MKSLKNIYKKETKLIEDHGVPMNYNDYEGRMAKQNLFKLHKYSKELFEMIHDYQEMESWVQEKIAKAADYIGSVKHYLEYEMEHPEDKNAFDSDEYYEHVQHIDDIIPEPYGGAHRYPLKQAELLKEKIINLIKELKKISIKELVQIRKEKYLNITSEI